MATSRLSARLLETYLPAFATVTFTKFPLKVCFGIDFMTIPLALKLEA